MTKLNKNDLIDRIATRTGFVKKDVRAIVDTLNETVADALAAGESVSVLGGVMEVIESAPRNGVKPGTTERITIPATKRVRFRTGSALKSTLN